MATEFKLPDLGEGIEEVDILGVLVAAGDSIERDQPVVEIESEKATLEVPSEVSGTVARVHVKPGETIRVGAPLLSVDEDVSAAPAETPSESVQVRDSPVRPERPAAPPAAVMPPLVLPEPTAEQIPHLAPLSDGAALPVPAAPSVRKLARELSVDIRTVRGSGPGGRISTDDVKAHVRAGARRAPAATEPQPLPDFSAFGEVETEPLSRLRRTLAANIGRSWSTIPHVTLFNRADVTDVEALRRRYAGRAEAAGGKLTITAIVLRVAAAGLKVFPRLNASIDLSRRQMVLKRYYHIGVAADTERGLVVPVVRDVDTKSVIELSVELVALAEKARAGALTLEQMHGASFTITNLGGLGTSNFTPIINPPEVAILGIGRAETRPVYIDGELRPRLLMPLALSFDHRAIDGADGARFLSWIVAALRDPLTLEMGA